MIEHVSFPVSDFEKAKGFYVNALAPLGYKLTQEYPPEAAGFKEGGHTSFWIVRKKSKERSHIAFRAKTREAVRAFYKAAIKAGGKDNGKPGLRKDYSPDYYAAFVLDPDGNNIEAVCFKK